MKKIFAIAAMMVATMPLAAQETYENAKIAMDQPSALTLQASDYSVSRM